jgi:hypothetical protein
VSWLRKHIAKELNIAVSESHLKQVMGELGLSTRVKANPASKAHAKANICIADLPGDRSASGDAPASISEVSELNLAQTKWNSIHGAANSISTYFTTAAQRNLWCCTQSERVSILS